MSDSLPPRYHAEHVVEVVCAYVSNNPLQVDALPDLIDRVSTALRGVSAPTIAAAEVAAPVPAVSVKKSVMPDYIICLEDGKRFKSLKRHLASKFNLPPDQYRQKWGLPKDYPMVAPAYSATRSRLAKDNGLGRSANHQLAN